MLRLTKERIEAIRGRWNSTNTPSAKHAFADLSDLQTALDDIEELTRQRDELLVALKGVCTTNMRGRHYSFARGVIAKVESSNA